AIPWIEKNRICLEPRVTHSFPMSTDFREGWLALDSNDLPWFSDSHAEIFIKIRRQYRRTTLIGYPSADDRYVSECFVLVLESEARLTAEDRKVAQRVDGC